MDESEPIIVPKGDTYPLYPFIPTTPEGNPNVTLPTTMIPTGLTINFIKPPKVVPPLSDSFVVTTTTTTTTTTPQPSNNIDLDGNNDNIIITTTPTFYKDCSGDCKKLNF